MSADNIANPNLAPAHFQLPRCGAATLTDLAADITVWALHP